MSARARYGTGPIIVVRAYNCWHGAYFCGRDLYLLARGLLLWAEPIIVDTGPLFCGIGPIIVGSQGGQGLQLVETSIHGRNLNICGRGLLIFVVGALDIWAGLFNYICGWGLKMYQ